MSADNGIYILKSKDGYRVIHAQCIDNLWWWAKDDRLYDEVFVENLTKRGNPNPHKSMWEERREINPRFLYNYFGKSLVFNTEDEAWTEAKRLYQEIMASDIPIIEYGISHIQGWEDKEFPSA